MKKLYRKKFYCIIVVLFLQAIFFSSNAIGQTIYKGDSVQLSIATTYRGTIKWQESVNGTIWTDIAGGTINNMSVKPLVNTQYRAVITEGTCDPIYSAAKSIIISADTGLVVNAPIITSSNAVSANLSGEVNQLGGFAKVTARGMCWSKLNNPTINDNKTLDGTGIGSFNSSISGLTPNTTYFIRSYIITDGEVVVYSKEIAIKTLESVTISFVDAYDITSTKATSGGLIKLNGTETAVARGVCWNTSQNPTISNSKSTDGAGDGQYSSSLTNLLPETIYYLRAYVTSSSGVTYYSSQITFETLSTYIFSVQTANVTAITGTTGTSGGTITMTGTGTVAARGVCWSTVELPTITDSKTSNGTGVGNFNSAITGLIPATTYYIRAYATSSTGKTTYGSQNVFNTNAAFTITTTLASDITAATAISGGNITVTTPNATILSRGVCYGTEINPTITGIRTDDGTTAGMFTSKLSELKANTKYYIRAYVTDGNNKTSYGNELSFFTQLPLTITITTSNPTNITLSSAASGGSITTLGPGSITAKGVCISTVPSPTLENNKTIDGTGTGAFTSALTNLISGELFYIRAYATSNSGITTYGNEIAFNSLSPISVTTGAVSGIGTVNANIQGSTTIIDQNRSIKARGFCWSTSTNPTISGTKSSENILNNGLFSSKLTGLTGNTKYYVRAYAVSESDVVYYGSEVTFQTLQPFSVNMVLNAATAITTSTANISGTYSSTGPGAVIGMGIAYSTSPSPTYNGKAPFGNLLAAFNYNFTNLISGTTYYARAYAITDTGLQYSNQISFKTVGYLSTITTQPASEITSLSTRLTMNWNLSGTEERTSSSILVSNKPNVSLNNKLDGSLIDFKAGSIVSSGNSYSVIMEGFAANTTYYAKSFIRMMDNTEIYSNEVSFSTLTAPATNLKVNTLAGIAGLTEKSASGLGQYSSTGGMKKLGFCFSTNPMPTIADNLSVGGNTNNISIIDGVQYPNFSGAFSNLLASTKYYYRAYAIDQNGALVYGGVLSFTTLAPSRTFSVNTPVVTKVEARTATLGWNVFSPNVAANGYERGVCYSLKPNPIREDFAVSEPTTFSISTWPVTGLIPNSTYYVRAYAYDPITQLTHYGNEVTFTTQYFKLINLELRDPPSETTVTSIKLNMNIYGEEAFNNTGFCYSTTPSPTVNNTKASDVVGVRYFTDAMTYLSTITGLAVNTTYYIRGYTQRNLDNTNAYVYSNELVYKTASLKVETYSNGAAGGLNYNTNNRITNYGSDTVIQRGIVYAVAADDLPTLAGGYYSFEGTGTTDFTGKIALPAYSTRYFIRAYVKTNSGQIIYGNVIDYTTIADPNPTPPTTTPPVCTGCTDTTPVTPPVVKGPGYLVFGRVLGPATLDCREGYGIFSDYKGYATKFVAGEFTNASFNKQSEGLNTLLKTSFPGEKYEYYVEASYNYSPTAKFATIIRYKAKIPGWDCYSTLIAIGYGTTSAEALAKAVERKNSNSNGGKDAKYTVIDEIKW